MIATVQLFLSTPHTFDNTHTGPETVKFQTNTRKVVILRGLTTNAPVNWWKMNDIRVQCKNLLSLLFSGLNFIMEHHIWC